MRWTDVVTRCPYATDVGGQVWVCPTELQGGRVGVLAHLQVVHHPDLAFDALAHIYRLGDK